MTEIMTNPANTKGAIRKSCSTWRSSFGSRVRQAIICSPDDQCRQANYQKLFQHNSQRRCARSGSKISSAGRGRCCELRSAFNCECYGENTDFTALLSTLARYFPASRKPNWFHPIQR